MNRSWNKQTNIGNNDKRFWWSKEQFKSFWDQGNLSLGNKGYNKKKIKGSWKHVSLWEGLMNMDQIWVILWNFQFSMQIDGYMFFLKIWAFCSFFQNILSFMAGHMILNKTSNKINQLQLETLKPFQPKLQILWKYFCCLPLRIKKRLDSQKR